MSRLAQKGILLLGMALFASCGKSSLPFVGQSFTGVATFYAADGTGNCSFDVTSAPVAAINGAQYEQAAYCGACAKVTDTVSGKSVVVRIVDKCPDCDLYQLDLSQGAFAQIADPTLGRVPITWSIQACDVTGTLSYRFKDGSSQWWTGIQVLNHRLPIEGLEVNTGGVWQAVPRQDYNYFVQSSGVGPNPFKVRVTGSNGEQLDDSLPSVAAGQTFSGTAQF